MITKEKFAEATARMIEVMNLTGEEAIEEKRALVESDEDFEAIMILSTACISGAPDIREQILNNWEEPEMQEFLETMSEIKSNPNYSAISSTLKDMLASVSEE